MKNEIIDALDEAIERAGGLTALARLLGLSSHNVIARWKDTPSVPAKYAPEIEVLTGVSCERLCPSVNWQVLRAAKSGVTNG